MPLNGNTSFFCNTICIYVIYIFLYIKYYFLCDSMLLILTEQRARVYEALNMTSYLR